MKLQIIAVWWVVLGFLQGPVAAQDWSTWITSNNHDVQYSWLGRYLIRLLNLPTAGWHASAPNRVPLSCAKEDWQGGARL